MDLNKNKFKLSHFLPSDNFCICLILMLLDLLYLLVGFVLINLIQVQFHLIQLF